MDTADKPKNLISLAGYFAILFAFFVTSKHPTKVLSKYKKQKSFFCQLKYYFFLFYVNFQVNWKTVLIGSLFQICFGLLILRTDFGFQAFSWLGELVTTFNNFVDHGAAFLFGDGFREHFFAFKVKFTYLNIKKLL